MEEEEDNGSQIYRDLFRKMDKNRDKLISYQELMILMKNCGYPCSEAELQDYVNDVNINENGEVDEEAFLNIIYKRQQEPESKEELEELFGIFDKNNTGLLTWKNILDIFSQIDQSIKEEEILQLFKECDLDQDGYLNFQEFCRMVKNK